MMGFLRKLSYFLILAGVIVGVVALFLLGSIPVEVGYIGIGAAVVGVILERITKKKRY